VINRVEIALQVQVDHLVVAIGHPFANIVNRLPRTLFRPKSVRSGTETCFKQRFDNDPYRRLRDSIFHSRNAQWPLPPVRLGDEPSTHRLGPVALVDQLLLEFQEKLQPPLRLNRSDRFAIDACRSAVAPNLSPSSL